MHCVHALSIIKGKQRLWFDHLDAEMPDSIKNGFGVNQFFLGMLFSMAIGIGEVYVSPKECSFLFEEKRGIQVSQIAMKVINQTTHGGDALTRFIGRSSLGSFGCH
ncbi:hypothetical protein ACFX2H_022326 [Malus domestica]